MLYDPSLNCDEQSALSEVAQQTTRQEERHKLEQTCQHELRSLTTAADIARRLAKIEAEKPASAPENVSACASPSEHADPAYSWISRSKASLSNVAGKLGLGPASVASAAATATAAQQAGPDISSSTSAVRRQAPAKALSGMSQPVARMVRGRPPSPPPQHASATGPVPPFLPPLLMQQLPPLLMLSMLRRNSQLSYWEMSAEGDGGADCDLGREEEEEEPLHDLQQQSQTQQQSKVERGEPCRVSTAHAQWQPSRSASPLSLSSQNRKGPLPRSIITAHSDLLRDPGSGSTASLDLRDPGSTASQSDPLPRLLLASRFAAANSNDLMLSLQRSPDSADSGNIPLLPSIFSDGRRSMTPSAAAGGSTNSTARRSLPSPEQQQQQQQQRGEGRVTPSWRELIVAGRTSRNSATPEGLFLHDGVELLGRAAEGRSSAHRLHRRATVL